MKVVLGTVLILSFALNIQAVINQQQNNNEVQQAQRREAPAETYGPPLPPEIPPAPPVEPQKEYGVPIVSVGPPKVNLELGPPAQQLPSPHPPRNFIPQQQRRPMPIAQRMNLIQRFISGLRNQQAGRVVNRIPTRPIAPQPEIYSTGSGSAGNYHSNSGTLKQFLSGTNHVSCEGWIPIPGPSISHDHHPQVHQESSGDVAGAIGDIRIGKPQLIYGPPETNDIGNLPPPPEPQIVHSVANVADNTNIEIQSSQQPNIIFGVPQQNYGPPVRSQFKNNADIQVPILITPEKNYGPPPLVSQIQQVQQVQQSQSGSLSTGYRLDNTYGPPEVEIQPPVAESLSSYGPPPSGVVSSNSVEGLESHLQLPHVEPAPSFNSVIGLATGAEVISGESEIVQSNTVHESHTTELANNFIGQAENQLTGQQIGGDSYSAPPIDSYAPGKYQPSYLKPRPNIPPPPPHFRPQMQAPSVRPPRPFIPQQNLRQVNLQRPVQGRYPPPPIPTKVYRQPPINLQENRLALTHGGVNPNLPLPLGQKSGFIPGQPGPRPQGPKYPLAYRTPVPTGLIESIGHQVQQLDAGQKVESTGNIYLPPPSSEIPIPSMDLNLPANGPTDFLSQHQHQQFQQQQQQGRYQQQSFVMPPYPYYDCQHGPQFSQQQFAQLHGQNSLAVGQAIRPHKTYGVPDEFQSPSGILETPRQAPEEFNPPNSSYGPPASGNPTDSLEFASSNTNVYVEAEKQKIDEATAQTEITNSFVIPNVQGKSGSYSLEFQSNNNIDSQALVSDGLLQSIITAVEQKPSQTVPQTSDDETDHSEVQIFLKSPDGQEVLNDEKPATN